MVVLRASLALKPMQLRTAEGAFAFGSSAHVEVVEALSTPPDAGRQHPSSFIFLAGARLTWQSVPYLVA